MNGIAQSKEPKPPNWDQWYKSFKKHYCCITVRQTKALLPVLQRLIGDTKAMIDVEADYDTRKIIIDELDNLEVIQASLQSQLEDSEE